MPTQNQLEKFIHRLHPVTRAMLRAPLEMRDAAAFHALHPETSVKPMMAENRTVGETDVNGTTAAL